MSDHDDFLDEDIEYRIFEESIKESGGNKWSKYADQTTSSMKMRLFAPKSPCVRFVSKNREVTHPRTSSQCQRILSPFQKLRRQSKNSGFLVALCLVKNCQKIRL